MLPELSPTNLSQARRQSFNGTIFRGHLEKLNPQTILDNIQVNVKQVILFEQFNPKAQKPPQLEYFLFGKGQELFLAHAITKAPDFDQILAVKVTNPPFTEAELSRGVQVIFPGTKNAAFSRLKAKQRIVGKMQTGNTQAKKKIQVEVDKELYFEEGELQLPPVFNQIQEEKSAGFS